MMRLLVRIIFWLGRPRWIVDDECAPGIEIFGIPIIYYKWNDTFIYIDNTSKYRLANKRELENCCTDSSDIDDSDWVDTTQTPLKRWMSRT